MSRGGLLACGAVVALAMAAGSWWLAGSGERPNILLITVDTLRADRLGCYGGSVATPNIDQLARDGTLFENAVCPMPLTRPAHLSMFTSRYPREHGVVHNATALPQDFETLAEALRAAGYRTAGFASVWLLNPDSGIGRGFDTLEAPAAGARYAAGETARSTIDWVARGAPGVPFFLWMHLFDPHIPYDPPQPYRPESPPEVAALLPIAEWGSLTGIAERNGGDLPAAVFARAKGLYDGEVRTVDVAVGGVIDALRGRGELDRTVVLFTADHGECFENGHFFEHANCLYEGSARVPLIVRYPTAVPSGVRRSEMAEHVDVAPTLLTLVRVDVPDSFAGRRLFTAVAAGDRFTVIQHPLPLPGILTRRQRTTSQMRSVAGMPTQPYTSGVGEFAVRSERWKYLVTATGEELYDLRSDPTERRDVAAQHPEIVHRARAELAAWKTKHPERDDGAALPITAAFRERLRALGYEH